MNAMSTIACTNFGDCRIAGKALWDERVMACPNCGKSLASPHQVKLDAIVGSVGEDTKSEVTVHVEFGNKCSDSAELSITIDGQIDGELAPVQAGSNTFEISGRNSGVYRIRAKLTTDDGRSTFSNEELLSVAQPSRLVPLLIWALLIVLLLCLGSYLGWFSKLGGVRHPWVSNAVDTISVVSGLLIGGLLIDLGWREKVRPDSESLVRLQALPPDGPFSMRNAALNKIGTTASSNVALIILGSLPFCFFFAWLAGHVFSDHTSLAFSIALVVAGAAFGVAFWRSELTAIGGKFTSRWRRIGPDRARGAQEEVAAPSPGSDAAVQAPTDSTVQPKEDKP
ncbi:MAG: hypothetical protein J0H42_29780 [Rhizobiales bacterium]|nr:hypothetical protein [Hyphomicrobiales bacterium]